MTRPPVLFSSERLHPLPGLSIPHHRYSTILGLHIRAIQIRPGPNEIISSGSERPAYYPPLASPTKGSLPDAGIYSLVENLSVCPFPNEWGPCYSWSKIRACGERHVSEAVSPRLSPFSPKLPRPHLKSVQPPAFVWMLLK